MVNTVEPLGTDTSLLQTVSNVPTKFSYILFKNPLQYGLSLIRTTHTKAGPQRVNSYELNLSIYYGHCSDQVNPEQVNLYRVNPTQGDSRCIIKQRKVEFDRPGERSPE